MNKAQMTKAQGKVATKSIHGLQAALVLDTTALYTERNVWGKATRFIKTVQTACKQDRLGIVTYGWLVLHVAAISWTPETKARVAKAEEFVLNFTGNVADILDENGYVNRKVVPADVTVSLFNNRNLVERPAEMVAAPAEQRTTEGEGFKLVEDARLVVRITVAEGVTYPWLRADNAAKAYAKENGNGAKLVRVHNTDNAEFVYNWSA